MGDILKFKPFAPRIRVIKPPLLGDKTLNWFADEFVGLIFSVMAVENYRHWNGEELESYQVSKGSAYRQLLQKSRAAANFLRDSPTFYEDYLIINAGACESLRPSRELACKIACL
jgi:hypothetical protein